MRTLLLTAILSVLFFAAPAHAIFIESNLFYFSDGLKTSTTNTNSRTFIDAALGFNLDSKGRFQVGWAYGSYSTTDTSSGSTTGYSSTMMGPKFNFYLGHDKSWLLGLTYGIVTNATYSTSGASTDKWRGTSYKAEFGYLFHLTDSGSSNLGLKLNYISAAYSDDFVGGSTYSKVSYSKSAIYPSIYYGINF